MREGVGGAGARGGVGDEQRGDQLARGGADGGRLEVKMAKLLWKTKDMSEVRGSVMEA